VIVDYVDDHRSEFGVEPICTVLQIAPSTYYAAKARAPSARSMTDTVTTAVIKVVHEQNYGVYGARKVHAALRRGGHRVHDRPVARCTVERLMRTAGLRGITRAKGPRTTIPGAGPELRPDLVERAFTAAAPDRLWVADITYCRTFAGWVYAAFVVDVFSRRVVGWQLSRSLRTDLALDALEMGLWTRNREGHDTRNLLHHSDKGVQYVAVRYTERLAEAGAVASVGSTGDSYDNALAEAFNSLFKAELVRNKGPWSGIDDLEIAVAEYIDWSTTDACTARSGWSHPSSSRPSTTVRTPPRHPPRRHYRASTKPGAGQTPESPHNHPTVADRMPSIPGRPKLAVTRSAGHIRWFFGAWTCYPRNPAAKRSTSIANDL